MTEVHVYSKADI